MKKYNIKTQNYGDKEKARELRRSMTAAEVVLWKQLRNNSIGYKFRRQHPIGPYILDFYCYELNLAIELDGSIHDTQPNVTHDEIRTAYLNEIGITVLRFTNDIVYRNVETVLESIKEYAISPHLIQGLHRNEIHVK